MGLVVLACNPLLGRQRQEAAPAHYLSLLGELQAREALCHTWGVTTNVDLWLPSTWILTHALHGKKKKKKIEIRAQQSEVVTHSLLINNPFKP